MAHLNHFDMFTEVLCQDCKLLKFIGKINQVEKAALIETCFTEHSLMIGKHKFNMSEKK